jgi:hypothetical protein
MKIKFFKNHKLSSCVRNLTRFSSSAYTEIPPNSYLKEICNWDFEDEIVIEIKEFIKSQSFNE